jgi:ABC-type dipeptide/oligopeptide/nickel transport system ATPase component
MGKPTAGAYEDTMSFADEVAVMYAGRIVE